MTKTVVWSRTGAMIAIGLALAASPVPAAEKREATGFERDRQSILAMSGNYKVTFDVHEQTPFVADYKPIPPKISRGEEIVRVVEDKGTFISLQHILIGETDDKKPVIIKHWRQDWAYEPEEILAYQGASTWALARVASADRTHAWSQTVYQTDDSPRYAGVGRWNYDNGIAMWTSGETLRPLARRDATRHPPFDRYVAINRHALTPSGWVHEQDNAKVGPRDGKLVTFVHEDVVNTYERSSDFNVAAGERYWAKTKSYWASVRGLWADALAGTGKIRVTEEAENGSVTGERLMGLADDIALGKLGTPDAVTKAKAIIAGREMALPASSASATH